MSARQTKGPRPFLSFQEGTFRLGDRLVFPNTTWALRADEQWAIVGANGSGKSLLADGLRGRLPLVRGELLYHFRPPAGLSPEEAIGHVAFEDRKHEVHGAVVQSRWNSLEDLEALRVREFLSYERVMEVNPFEVTGGQAGARRQFGRRRRRAAEVLNLESLLGRTLLSLSNGERQRVELARALCRPLRLLILDEPFVGLDTAMRAQLQLILARLMATPLRVLLITTRPEDLPRQVTHVMRVENCRVASAGKRRETLGAATGPFRRSRARKVKRAAECSHVAVAGDGHASGELIRLNQVTVRYGKREILRNISWTVRAGESWALLGPNGSGKSTLLSLLLGDNPQVYANDIRVFGRRRDEGESVWELKKQIGWVSPELHVHFDDTISVFAAVGSGFHESIGLFEPLNWRQRAAVRHWLKRFGLGRYAGAPLFALSAGMQRMALLARALVKRPRLLILDEPCQGLDAAHRRRFVNTVDTLLHGGSVTAIYVTHRPDEIPRSIRRVLRLAEGQASVGREE